VYLRLGRIDRAIADYDAALGLEPRDPYALYGRGIARRRRGDAARAGADIAAARAILPDVAEAFAQHGVRP
jgi:tetratricopeptide (TPR) repeat protein